ncbi:formimidoylglutamase [Flavobacteriaceae bacterium AU392]|nr:formimidoylglutamase [Flavobacteriaceae bacterium]RKM81448.1 formimidoylglutamase [Flavobacteriaceae bacterium AU392]
MKNNKLQQLNVEYIPGQKTNWTGRSSNPKLDNQYWYQSIVLKDINNLKIDDSIDIAIIGYVCDEGVRRNLGRVGAKDGAKILRERLAKLPIHYEAKLIADVGDVVCVEDDMEACQKGLANGITNLLENNIFPIAIGGGHDIAYGHFMGIQEFVKNISNKKIGIINFDAHFDLRTVDKQSNSGTPFNQIIQKLKDVDETLEYFVVGIQQQSNTKELFDIAQRENVDYTFNDDCQSISDIEVLKNKLTSFVSKVDYIYLTIDMDCFSSAFAPGVSAPSPLGLTPQVVFEILNFLLQTKKIISCDIAELNPVVDFNNHTSNLVARLVDFIVMNYPEK